MTHTSFYHDKVWYSAGGVCAEMVKNLQRIGRLWGSKLVQSGMGRLASLIFHPLTFTEIFCTHKMKFLLNLCSKYLPQREPSKVSRALESVQTQEPGAKAEGASKADRGQSTIVYHSVWFQKPIRFILWHPKHVLHSVCSDVVWHIYSYQDSHERNPRGPNTWQKNVNIKEPKIWFLVGIKCKVCFAH